MNYSTKRRFIFSSFLSVHAATQCLYQNMAITTSQPTIFNVSAWTRRSRS